MSEQTKNLLGGSHNPDVLECLANLSNDEVFTPPKVVNQMLDMFPEETWGNPELKFLDPACKTGVFLREIAKRLLVGLQEKIPDLQERIDHILQNQLYGIAITELTALASRRSLYCSKYANGKYSVSKFDNPDGNIRYVPINHTWENGKCKYCGASASQYQRTDDLETHAYEFIHTNNPEEIFGMKFDVIIGNPPYQITTGGGQSQAMPLYHKFVLNAKLLAPNYLCMITPSRWMSGGMGMNEYREEMVNDRKIRDIYDYSMSTDCFPGVDIAGGVSYFLRDASYDGDCNYAYFDGGEVSYMKRPLNEFELPVRNNNAVSIIHKVKEKNEESINTIMSSLSPFGLNSSERGDVKLGENDSYELLSSAGIGRISKKKISPTNKYLNKWKVIIGKATSAGAATATKDGSRKVIATLKILRPGSVCTFSYFIAGSFDNKEDAENCKKYLSTKFARFLLLQCLSSINIAKDKFAFVPIQNFNEEWNDERLYKKYGLSSKEIDLIESMIKPMEDK